MVFWSQLGDTWSQSSSSSLDDHRRLLIVSKNVSNASSIRLCFLNYTNDPLLLCWMSEQGTPHHFYRLDPTARSAHQNQITVHDRIETTVVGHAFQLAAGNIKEAQRTRSLQNTTFVGAYRPTTNHPTIHMIEIYPQSPICNNCCFFFCWPFFTSEHSKKTDNNNDDDNDNDEGNLRRWRIKVTPGRFDATPIDTTTKIYTAATLGGWPVRLDPAWDSVDPILQIKLATDLERAMQVIPSHAVRQLLVQDNDNNTYTNTNKCATTTLLWVNKTLTYGPAATPRVGRGCCFHTGAAWLEQQGMHPEKAQCIELYDLDYYQNTSTNWGMGGVMVHELSHAYHFKCLPQGYENPEIIQCYKAAMKEGLYDRVAVHGHGQQQFHTRAYACENHMEYWAELSTAFLGGLHDKEEYNKWFPFNREQLKRHDPRAFKLLQRLWQVHDYESESDIV
jgi:hypothetical protein